MKAPFTHMLRAKAREVFAIDSRSLAVFRVGFGLLLLWDLGFRALSLRAHYTDEGLLPRAAWVATVGRHRGYWSLHALSGSLEMEGLLFALAAAFAIMLTIGLRTRLATCGSCLLLLSLQYRNPLLSSGADFVMYALLFWSIFLPLGRSWSFDSRRGSSEGRHVLLWGMPTAAILLQVCFVYWFTAWLKASQSPEWWPEGTAIQGALSSYYAKSLGVALLAFPRLLRALTYSTLALETLGPVLALSPAWNGPARILAVGLFCGLHLGMALTLYLAHFPVVSVLGWLLFLPSCFWERWSPHRRDVPRQDPPQGFSWLVNCVTALLLLFVFANNARPIDKLRPLARALGLEQHWSMFVEPKKIDLIGFVAPGKTQDAREIDLLHHGRPVSLGSAAIVEAHAEPYWRAMWRNSDKDRAFYLPLAADDLCRGWNARAGSSDRVDGVEIYLVRRKASHELRDLPEVERVRLLEAQCPGAGPGHSSVPLVPGGS